MLKGEVYDDTSNGRLEARSKTAVLCKACPARAMFMYSHLFQGVLMMKKILSLSLLFCLAVCSTAMADLIDPFNVAHDYLTSGVAGTGWSGIMNVGNATILNASITAADKLRMTGVGDWGGTGAGGPFLYKEVTGDFIAGRIPAEDISDNGTKSTNSF